MSSLYRNALIKLNILFILADVISGQEPCTTPALESGFCVPYKDCPYVNDLAKSYGSSDAIPSYYKKYIFKSRCSKEGEPISLCCKLPSNYVKPSVQTTAAPQDQNDLLHTADLDYTRDYNSQFHPEGLNILNQLNCGNPGGDRVAGGTETDLKEFPWMALLRYDPVKEDFECGGSLISNRYVLTAAHCVKQNGYKVFGIRLGEHDISTNPDCRQRLNKNICNPVVEDFEIEKIISHPRYKRMKRINDVALIKVDRDVEFKPHIKPVCLPITVQSYEASSTAFTIAGWGTTENQTKSHLLLKASVYWQSRSVCHEYFSSIEINEKHICAGDLETGSDSCKGDSGGPLVTLNIYNDNKRFIQYGIVSAGLPDCNPELKFLGIYTNVLNYLPWITSNIID